MYLGRKWPSGLDDKQSPNAQDVFQPIPGLISCAGVTGSVGITCHARATQMAGLRSSQSHSLVALPICYTCTCIYNVHVHVHVHDVYVHTHARV